MASLKRSSKGGGGHGRDERRGGGVLSSSIGSVSALDVEELICALLEPAMLLLSARPSGDGMSVGALARVKLESG